MTVRLLLWCTLVALGCAALPAADAPAASPAPKRKVLIVGVDGLRPDQLRLARTPRIDFLIAAGSVSYAATNCWTPEHAYNGHSAPNWATMLTGVAPAEHAIANNGDGKHLIDDDGDNPEPGDKVRTIFGHAKRHDPAIRTAVVNNWAGIGMKPGTILDHSHTVVDHHYCTEVKPTDEDARDTDTAAAAAEMLRSTGRFPDADPDLLFVHFSQVDTAGHAFTYDSPEYRAAIERVDAHVGGLLDAIYKRPNYRREDWLILLSADHGGPSNGKSHGDTGDVQVRTIPLIVSGRGAVKGADLRDASIYHVTPTALAHLGVPLDTLGLRAGPIGLRPVNRKDPLP